MPPKSTTPRKPRARKPPAPPPVNGNGHHADADLISLPGFEPLRLGEGEPRDERRAVLFYDDDGIARTVPVAPPASIGMAALDIMGSGGDDPLTGARAAAASDRLVLVEMLGEDGYKALRDSKKITGPELRKIMRICSELAFGALEDPKNR